MEIKRFGAYTTLAELDYDLELFCAGVDVIEVRYQTIIVDGLERFTAMVSYKEKYNVR